MKLFVAPAYSETGPIRGSLAISPYRGILLTGLCQVSGSPGPGRPWPLDARRLASLSRRGGWLRLGLGVGDQVPVPHRIVPDGELKHAVEDQPPATGPAPVEASDGALGGRDRGQIGPHD
jgi:hypothetical protein